MFRNTDYGILILKVGGFYGFNLVWFGLFFVSLQSLKQ